MFSALVTNALCSRVLTMDGKITIALANVQSVGKPASSAKILKVNFFFIWDYGKGEEVQNKLPSYVSRSVLS